MHSHSRAALALFALCALACTGTQAQERGPLQGGGGSPLQNRDATIRQMQGGHGRGTSVNSLNAAGYNGDKYDPTKGAQIARHAGEASRHIDFRPRIRDLFVETAGYDAPHAAVEFYQMRMSGGADEPWVIADIRTRYGKAPPVHGEVEVGGPTSDDGEARER